MTNFDGVRDPYEPELAPFEESAEQSGDDDTVAEDGVDIEKYDDTGSVS